MKREDVKNKIPGITDEQLNWIMQENGADINREKSVATALQTQLDNANAQLKTAQDGLKAFDGVDVAGLQEQVTKLKADMKAQAEGFAFDNALNAAIMSKKGRSVKAVRALLDLDTLKGSADRSTDIGKALDEAATANPWAFGEDAPTPAPAPGYPVLPGGGEPRHLPSEKDGVTAAFMDRNPGLKI